MTLSLPQLALIALVLLVLASVLLRLAVRLALRAGARSLLGAIGQKALDQQPDLLDLKPAPSAAWADAALMQSMAKPLFDRGFADCGVHATDKMPGVRIWFLLNEETSVAAFLYEHPKAPPWAELSVRYEDGTTTAASNLPPTGINMAPAFFRRLEAPPGTPTDRLYERLLRERSPSGVKRVTRAAVVDEYEVAYARLMAWRKNRGITPEEVAAVGKKWLEKRQSLPGPISPP